jgi:hypothetical protein
MLGALDLVVVVTTMVGSGVAGRRLVINHARIASRTLQPLSVMMSMPR